MKDSNPSSESPPSSRSARLPRLALTVGDVAGIGPELAITCATDRSVLSRCLPILYGPANALRKIAQTLQIPVPCEICDIGEVDTSQLEPGTVTAETGLASFQAVERAIEDAQQGTVDAVVTGPIQKEAWHQAGIRFPGHTELLAERTGIEDFCMMLTSEEVSCVLATIHVPLADVPRLLSVEAIERAIRLGGEAISLRLGRPARITVCGLNPHAGENGLFSHGEELNLIQPAIDATQADGFDVRGPLPPDTAFTASQRQATDVYVCMYHDQGLIPLKALAFDDAVNVTLGLPIVRTSVDHGTALDLAWQGTASSQSMRSAISMAIDLVGAPAK